MAPVEPWEKALVDAEAFLPDVHGQIACTECHGGVQDADKATAHTDLVADPASGPDSSCAACHAEETEMVSTSLHTTLQGYWTVLDARSVPENHPPLEEMFGNHCASCHAACGDCHISRPDSVGGGLVDGHTINRTPSMSQNCTACHGSRVGNEYLGKNEGVLADVHFRQGRMTCITCHSGQELHGEARCTECHEGAEFEPGAAPADRYAGIQSPLCTDCHPTVASGADGVVQHQAHEEKLSCQVCHSVTYTSCDGCHVAVSEASDRPFFETEGSYPTFLIGRNPLQNAHRPYEYVPVRHVPIAETSFEYYGEALLSNFDAQPTWKYATPHNIQRDTPQNESCASCHGNPDIFLTAEKVNPAELEANRPVIVESVPPAMP